MRLTSLAFILILIISNALALTNSSPALSNDWTNVMQIQSEAPLFAQINGKFKIFAVVKRRASTVFDNWDAYSAINPNACEIANRLPTFIKIEACKK